MATAFETAGVAAPSAFDMQRAQVEINRIEAGGSGEELLVDGLAALRMPVYKYHGLRTLFGDDDKIGAI